MNVAAARVPRFRTVHARSPVFPAILNQLETAGKGNRSGAAARPPEPHRASAGSAFPAHRRGSAGCVGRWTWCGGATSPLPRSNRSSTGWRSTTWRCCPTARSRTGPSASAITRPRTARCRRAAGPPRQRRGPDVAIDTGWSGYRLAGFDPTPDGRMAAGSIEDPRPIAYKTCTSYGFRDAWAVGYSPSWTVGVWTGRADGTPRPAYGRNTAAALLFAVFDRLPTETEPDALARVPDALRTATQAPVSRGLPIPTPAWAAVPSWQPDGPGFVKVTVADAAGRRPSATVRVRRCPSVARRVCDTRGRQPERRCLCYGRSRSAIPPHRAGRSR